MTVRSDREDWDEGLSPWYLIWTLASFMLGGKGRGKDSYWRLPLGVSASIPY